MTFERIDDLIRLASKSVSAATRYTPNAFELESLLADHISVRLYAEIETRLGVMFARRCLASVDAHLGRFSCSVGRFGSPVDAPERARKMGRLGYADLTGTLADFGPDYLAAFEAQLVDRDLICADWSKMSTARHVVAHGRGSTNLTLSELSRIYGHCCKLVEALGQSIGLTQSQLADLR